MRKSFIDISTRYDLNLPLELMANCISCFSILGRLLGSNEISFSSDGTNATFRVMFKEPIEIQHNTNYTASATLKVCDNLTIKIAIFTFLHEISQFT